MIKTLPVLEVDNLIKITWLDQNSYTEAHPAKGALNTCYGFTVGFYLEHNKEWICIGMEKMCVDNTQDTYRHIVSLPLCAIKNIVRLMEDKQP